MVVVGSLSTWRCTNLMRGGAELVGKVLLLVAWFAPLLALAGWLVQGEDGWLVYVGGALWMLWWIPTLEDLPFLVGFGLACAPGAAILLATDAPRWTYYVLGVVVLACWAWWDWRRFNNRAPGYVRFKS